MPDFIGSHTNADVLAVGTGTLSSALPVCLYPIDGCRFSHLTQPTSEIVRGDHDVAGDRH